MKLDDKPIVTPLRGKHAPKLGSRAVIAAALPDLKALRILMDFPEDNVRPLFHGKLFFSDHFCLTGPVMGAPQAAMVLETLISWGAKQFVFFGWCGSLSSSVCIGDVVLPTGAIVDEGTSMHYIGESGRSFPSEALLETLRNLLLRENRNFHQGMVWSTDAIFRETPQKVISYRRQGALAVDMEVSAVFSVGSHHGVNVAAVLTVSDEVGTLSWNRGFKDPRFLSAREAVFTALNAFCRAP
jgi:uridine phosphorylase